MTEKKKAEKWAIIRDAQLHKDDTGSTEVQMELLRDEIARLQKHCNESKKDFVAIKQLKIRAHKLKKLAAYFSR